MSTALIGKRLKALRDKPGIDQDAVAEMLGLGSRQIVSNIETGERKIAILLSGWAFRPRIDQICTS